MTCRSILTGVALTLCISLLSMSASHAVTISGEEIWNGQTNPQAAAGVTVSGDDASGYVYTIPDGLTFDAGAKIRLYDGVTAIDWPISFDFAAGGGGINWGTDGAIDIDLGRRGGGVDLTFNLNDNSVGPAGVGTIWNEPIQTGADNTRASGSVIMMSSGDIGIGTLATSSWDAGGGRIDITAYGGVTIDSLINNDASDGGNPPDTTDIKAKFITIGDINADTERNGDSPAANGTVNLTALGPPDFNDANGLANTAADNVVTLNGFADLTGFNDTNQVDSPNGGLNVTAVKIVLGANFDFEISANPDSPGVIAMRAGTTGNGFTQDDLFMDMANSGLGRRASYDVAHDIPEPSSAILLTIGGLLLRRRRR